MSDNLNPMTILDAISRLTEILKEHGDLPLRMHGARDDCDVDVREICVYDETGNSGKKIVEAYIHGF